jgi:hypothetical protein
MIQSRKADFRAINDKVLMEVSRTVGAWSAWLELVFAHLATNDLTLVERARKDPCRKKRVARPARRASDVAFKDSFPLL